MANRVLTMNSKIGTKSIPGNSKPFPGKAASKSSQHETSTGRNQKSKKSKRSRARTASARINPVLGDEKTPSTRYRRTPEDFEVVEVLDPYAKRNDHNKSHRDEVIAIKRKFLDVQYILQNPTTEAKAQLKIVEGDLRALETQFLERWMSIDRFVDQQPYIPPSFVSTIANSHFGNDPGNPDSLSWLSHALYLAYIFENDPVYLKTLQSRIREWGPEFMSLYQLAFGMPDI